MLARVSLRNILTRLRIFSVGRLDVLARVPNASLWLVREPPFPEPRLRAVAARHQCGAERLVWTGRVAGFGHMDRVKRRAGLYLDTSPFGGHSTAVEALWAGLPVLTSPASRYCPQSVFGYWVP